MNKPKAIGTKAETAVTRFLIANGFPHAERRALRGTHDCGDITGTPGICWEIKGGEAARNASDAQITAWLVETETERINAAASIGVLVLQRRGVGPTNAGRWWAITRANAWVLGARKWDFPVRVVLADMCTLLRSAGYGQPLELEVEAAS